jgi:hypothetical protein
VGRQKGVTANRRQLIVCRGHAWADGAPYRYVMYNNIDVILDLFVLPAISETVVWDEIALVPLPMGVDSRFEIGPDCGL